MPGAERLRDCGELEALVRAQRDSGRLYAAICATPYVFLQVGKGGKAGGRRRGRGRRGGHERKGRGEEQR